MYEYVVFDARLAKYAVLLPAMSAHWCTLLGLSVGNVDLVNVPHPHTCPFEEDDVEK